MADDALVEGRLGGRQACEGGAGKLAGIPGVIGRYLRVADVGAGGERKDTHCQQGKDTAERKKHGAS